MNKIKQYTTAKDRREIRNRLKVKANSTRPRLVVNRSNKHLSAQIVDDQAKKSLTGAHTGMFHKDEKLTKSDKAKLLGQEIASRAKEHKIKAVAFDRGSLKYHGRVKTFAEAAKEAGLII